MKKFSVVTITLVFLMTLIIPVTVAANQVGDVKLSVNGQEIKPDVPPFIDSNSRTMVPLRFAAEALGSNVDWDADSKTVTVERDNTQISLVIGEKVAEVNSELIDLDTNAIIKDQRTMVPLRFISEALGAKVEWDAKTRTVVITDTGAGDVIDPEPAPPVDEDTTDHNVGDVWEDKIEETIPCGGMENTATDNVEINWNWGSQ